MVHVSGITVVSHIIYILMSKLVCEGALKEHIRCYAKSYWMLCVCVSDALREHPACFCCSFIMFSNALREHMGCSGGAHFIIAVKHTIMKQDIVFPANHARLVHLISVLQVVHPLYALHSTMPLHTLELRPLDCEYRRHVTRFASPPVPVCLQSSVIVFRRLKMTAPSLL